MLFRSLQQCDRCKPPCQLLLLCVCVCRVCVSCVCVSCTVVYYFRVERLNKEELGGTFQRASSGDHPVMCPSLKLPCSLAHAQAHTPTHTHTHEHPHTHTHTPTHTHTYTQSKASVMCLTRPPWPKRSAFANGSVQCNQRLSS